MKGIQDVNSNVSKVELQVDKEGKKKRREMKDTKAKKNTERKAKEAQGRREITQYFRERLTESFICMVKYLLCLPYLMRRQKQKTVHFGPTAKIILLA